MTDTPVPDVTTTMSVVASQPPPFQTPYDVAAAQFIAALDAAIALIPFFVQRHPENEKFVQRYLSFSDKLVPKAIAAAEACPELAATKKFNVAKALAAGQFDTAFRTVIDTVDELSTNLKFTRQVLKAEAIADALQLYAIAKGIGRDPSSADVAAHADIMKRNLKAPPRAKAAKAKETPAPDPTKPSDEK